MRKIASFMLGMLLGAMPAIGASFYVSSAGNDGWSGTLAAPNSTNTDGPFRTLSRAQSALQNSTTIKTATLRTGTYSIQGSNLTFGWQDSGETWIAYTGESPVIDGGGTGFLSSSGANTLTFQNLTFQNLGPTSNGIDMELNGSSHTIRGNTFLNCNRSCLGGGSFSDSTIDGNTFNGETETTTAFDFAIKLWYGSSNNRITHNLIENIQGGGVGIATGINNNVPDPPANNNLIDRNILRDVNTNALDSGALYMADRTHASVGNQMTNNIIDGNGGAAFQTNLTKAIYLDDLMSNVLVSGNVCRSCGEFAIQIHAGDHNTIANNIFDISNGVTLGIYQENTAYPDHGMGGNVFRNNLVYFSGTVPNPLWQVNIGANDALMSDSTNLYYAVSGAGIPNSGQPLVDAHPIDANPQFTNPSAGDYSMPQNSPAFTQAGFQALPTDQGPQASQNQGPAPTSTPWTGILDPSRAIDWSGAGVPGGVPSASWPQCGATIAAGASADTINAAIQNCAANHVVLLGAGTFTLAGEIVMKSNVVLRGMGADQTSLVFNNVNFTWPAPSCTGSYATICFQGSSDYSGGTTTQPGGSNAADWTGGYAPGTTQITLNNVGSAGIAVGQYIYLDQDDDMATNNGLFTCETPSANPPCSLQGGGGDPGRIVNGRARQQIQIVRVTAVNGNTYTITPGLYAPNWSAAKNPGAWWPSSVIQNAGLENVSVDATNSGGLSNITLFNAANVWIKGTRQVRACQCNRDILQMDPAVHATIQDNYFYGTAGQNQNYGIEAFVSGDNLITNNIFQHVVAPMMIQGNQGSVYAYNYAINDSYLNSDGLLDYMSNAVAFHTSGNMYNLLEGNIGPGIGSDVFHGNSTMDTLFRNWLLGSDPGRTNATTAINLMAWNRYFNLIGNVLGTPGFTINYNGGLPTIYALGNGNSEQDGFTNNQLVTVPSDPLVATTLMRWGNYDTVHGATQWNTGEVPSGVTPYGNAVPASQSLPASFYTSVKPAWWPGAKAWPPIGPDVNGGNIANLNGHANTLPAEDCYHVTMGGPVDGSGNALSFNAAACYGTPTADTTAPSIPANVAAVAVSSTAINVSWMASTDNVGVAGYGIYRNSIWISSVTSGTAYQDTGRAPSTTYTYAVTAYDAAGNVSALSATATATTPAISNQAPTVAAPASAAPNPVGGVSATLSVLGADDGGEAALTYTWATTGTPPAAVTFSTNTSHAAKTTTATFTKAGNYSFQVTIRDAGNQTVASSTGVVVAQTLTSIAVSPVSASVAVNGAQSFSATARDQFNAAFTVPPAMTWTASGGGNVNGAGLFTAGSIAGGPFTVTAASGGKSGAAQVTVTAGVPPSVLLTSPANGATFTAPATIALAATATAGANPISRVQFWHDGVILSTDTTSPYSFGWTNVPAGIYDISAIVFDSQGASNASATAEIVVNAGTTSPVNSLTVPDLSGLDGKTFGLTDDISFGYPQGGVTFEWTFTPVSSGFSAAVAFEATAASQTSGSTSAPRFTPASHGMTPGVYQLTVTAIQGSQSQSATATVTLVAADLSGIDVYPNPWRSDKHAGKSMTFDRLPASCRIKIFTASGHLARDLGTASGKITWDLTNDSGDKVGSGIYLYIVTDAAGHRIRGKLSIIK